MRTHLRRRRSLVSERITRFEAMPALIDQETGGPAGRGEAIAAHRRRAHGISPRPGEPGLGEGTGYGSS